MLRSPLLEPRRRCVGPDGVHSGSWRLSVKSVCCGIADVSSIHEVGDKSNLDSYRRALRRLSAGVSTLVQLRASLGFERGCKEHRVPDPAGGPADPGDVCRHLGRCEGGIQPPVVGRAIRVLPGTDVPVLQRKRPHLRGGLQSAWLRGPRPRRAGPLVPFLVSAPGLVNDEADRKRDRV